VVAAGDGQGVADLAQDGFQLGLVQRAAKLGLAGLDAG